MTITEPLVANGTAPPAVLSAHGVIVRFGGLTALSEVDISIPAGALVGLVGPNGAGKTTLFGVMSGILHPSKGRVMLLGTDVTKASSETRARLGLARTFQQPELFLDLTVREHFVLAYRVRHYRSRLWKDVIPPRRHGSTGCWSCCHLTMWPTSQCASCHWEPAGWSKSVERWQRHRLLFCWTNRPPVLTGTKRSGSPERCDA
jgi:ABC-type sugar transport system ATPase subunit